MWVDFLLGHPSREMAFLFRLAQRLRPKHSGHTLMAPLTVWPVNLGKSIASVVTARASMTFFDLLSKTPANAAAKIEDLGHPYNLAG